MRRRNDDGMMRGRHGLAKQAKNALHCLLLLASTTMMTAQQQRAVFVSVPCAAAAAHVPSDVESIFNRFIQTARGRVLFASPPNPSLAQSPSLAGLAWCCFVPTTTD